MNRLTPPTTFTRRSRGFTLVELLVVIAIISVIAGFLIPTLITSREKANVIACANNLREIVKMGISYADSGNRFFPYKSTGSHDSMNQMLDFFSGGTMKYKPKMFVCPSWRGEPAEVDEDGLFMLDEQSFSYTWSSQKLAPTDSRDISSDKVIKSEDELSGHELGMNVASTDSSVRWLQSRELGDEDLPKGLTP